MLALFYNTVLLLLCLTLFLEPNNSLTSTSCFDATLFLKMNLNIAKNQGSYSQVYIILAPFTFLLVFVPIILLYYIMQGVSKRSELMITPCDVMAIIIFIG